MLMHSSATLKCSSCVFSILPPYLFPSGEEEVRGEVGGPASGKTEPRSLGGVGEPPSDPRCNRFSDLWDILLLSAWHLIQMCWTGLLTGQSVAALPTVGAELMEKSRPIGLHSESLITIKVKENRTVSKQNVS